MCWGFVQRAASVTDDELENRGGTLGGGELLSGAYVPPMRRAGTVFRLLGLLFGFLAILSPGRHNGVGCVLPCGDSPAPLEPVMSILAFLCCLLYGVTPLFLFQCGFPHARTGFAMFCEKGATRQRFWLQSHHYGVPGSKEPPRPFFRWARRARKREIISSFCILGRSRAS